MLKVEWKGEEVGDGMYMLFIWAQVKETLILLIEIIHFPASVVYTNKEIAKNYSFSFDILGNCTEINETKLQRFKVFLEFLIDLRIENSSNSY